MTRRSVKHLRKILSLAVGLPVFIVGVILIPLPGPGLLLCFVGLYVLSLEFDWAEQRLSAARRQIKAIYLKAKARADKIENAGTKNSKNSK